MVIEFSEPTVTARVFANDPSADEDDDEVFRDANG